jgi:hypothetical protein
MNYYLAEIFVVNKLQKARHYRLVKAGTHGEAIVKATKYCETAWPSVSNEWEFVIHTTLGADE